jgi:hypothetical protein
MEINDGLRLSGKITIDTYRTGFIEAVQPYLTQLQRFRRLSKVIVDVQGEIEQLVDTIDAIRREYHIRTAGECRNLIMGSSGYGLDIIIQRLVGMNTYSLNIMFGEIGTGSTPPALSDTALTTPAKRAAVGFQQDFGQTDAVVQFFFSDSQLANTTYNEFGTFIDGTSTIGSGQLFNHALLSPAYVKEAGTDTTVQVDIAVANS